MVSGSQSRDECNEGPCTMGGGCCCLLLLLTPSWMRAPPESSRPMQGTLAFMALSITCTKEGGSERKREGRQERRRGMMREGA